MKKAKRIIALNIFIIAVAIAYVFVLILGNVFTVKVSFATVSGSYADKYAKDHRLESLNLADNQKQYFDQRYELFDYNYENGGVVLQRYSGVSSELVIPAVIDGDVVVGLSQEFIDSLSSVKRLYIPPTLVEINATPDNSFKICCSDDSLFYATNKESDWTIENTIDSDFVNFFLGDLEFNYNINGATAEIVSYKGDYASLLVIPSYINGYPVTKISMDLIGEAEGFVVPETVTDISGKTGVNLYTAVFAIELLFSVIAFALSLISLNILLPKYKTVEDNNLRGSQVVTIVLYVLAQIGFSIVAIYFADVEAYVALIISVVILFVFIGMMMAAGRGREQAIEVENHIAQKTSRMKSIKIMAKGLSEGIKDPELKKQAQRLEEEIGFSDPVSDETLGSIEAKLEQDLIELRKAINDEDIEMISLLIANANKTIKERNIICKAKK